MIPITEDADVDGVLIPDNVLGLLLEYEVVLGGGLVWMKTLLTILSISLYDEPTSRQSFLSIVSAKVKNKMLIPLFA